MKLATATIIWKLFIMNQIEAGHPLMTIDENNNVSLQQCSGEMKMIGTAAMPEEVRIPLGVMFNSVATPWDRERSGDLLQWARDGLFGDRRPAPEMKCGDNQP